MDEHKQNILQRQEQIKKLKSQSQWDLLVIGGGASGLGVALDAVSRGLKTILVEKYDFGKGTSSKSTKLIHGGVRYLQQGNISLVREALKERDYLLEKASHNAHLQAFIIPFYNIWLGLFYYTGLKLYDLLAGRRKIGKTKWLSKKSVIDKLPQLSQHKLKGGILYYDGQFDDARMCIDLMKTIQIHGGICLNYMSFIRPLYTDKQISGGILKDVLKGDEIEIKAKYVVNATGVFTDAILQLDNPRASKKIIPSRGSHIVVDKKFIESDYAIMLPKTTDGRVLFAIPWNDKLILGTTDVKSNKPVIEPRITSEEVQFILENCRNYFTSKPEVTDILAVYSGLRPLAAPDNNSSKTKEISRGHKILVSESGLISIIGGKWTTFRKMGEDVIDFIEKKFNENFSSSTSESIRIEPPAKDYFGAYPLIEMNSDFIKYLIEHEMACTIEDVLARRTRILFLNAHDALSKSEDVAKIMQKLLHKEDDWSNEQLINFRVLVNKYIPQDA